MFGNIKKLSEFSPLSGRFVYQQGKKDEKEAAALKESVEKPTAEALAAFREQMESIVYVSEQKLRILQEGREYKEGDWVKLNKKFTEEFAKEGVEPARSEALLKRFQKEAFEALKLTGDPFAVPDGNLGVYTLYAFALYFNLSRPKASVPAGNPRLEKLIEEDTKKAFEDYRKFAFAKDASYSDFKKIYADIKVNTSFFNPDPQYSKVTDWAIALMKAGYDQYMAQSIGFPRIRNTNDIMNSPLYIFIRASREEELKDKMVFALEWERGDKTLYIVVGETGKMYRRNPDTDQLEPLLESHEEWQDLNTPQDKVKKKPEAPKPAEPKPEAPAPQSAPKPATPPGVPFSEAERNLVADQLYVIGPDGKPDYQGDYFYRFSNGTFKNAQFDDVAASVALPRIATAIYARDKEGGGKEYYYELRGGDGAVTAYYNEQGKRFRGYPYDAVKVQQAETAVAAASRTDVDAQAEAALSPIRLKAGPVRRTLLAEHVDIERMKEQQVKKYLEDAGFTDVENKEGQFFFKKGAKELALAIRSSQFIQYNVKDGTEWPSVPKMVPEPSKLVKKEKYQVGDMPIILGYLKEQEKLA